MLFQLSTLIFSTKENDHFCHQFAEETTAGFGMHSVVNDSAVKVVLHERQQTPAGRNNKSTQEKSCFGERRLISSTVSFTAATGLN